MRITMPKQLGVRFVQASVRLWERTAFLRYASPKDWIKGVAVIVTITAAATAFSEYGIYLDSSEVRCMPEYLYAARPRDGAELKAGDIVSFVAAKEEMMGLMAGKRIGKLVMAIAGDRVLSNEHGVTINGKLIALRSDISLANMAKKGFSPVSTDRVMAKGEIFVMGTMPRSFDSRYWGPMQASHIDKFVTPLL